MANFNKVFLMGNLTRDVELRYTQGGSAVAKLGMAINRKFTTNNETRESTCFVDLTAFGRQAEVLNQYMSKGRPLFVEGRLEFSTWEGQDGAKRSKLEVIIENFQFIGAPSRAGGEQRESGAPSPKGAAAGEGAEQVDYGDIPF